MYIEKSKKDTMQEVSREARLTLQYINQTDQHIFLTGKAGTGKTTLLREIIETTHKRTIVVAPTGIAALNARGVTIHSFFLLPFASFIPTTEHVDTPEYLRIENQNSLLRHFKISAEKKALFRNMELLVIDEVSMLRADVLDAMDYMLRRIRKNSEAFGGVQVLFIGDLLQLPPVVRNEEWEILKKFYNGMYFFNAHCLQKQPPLYIELDKVYRQNDEQFLNLLNNVRHQQMTKKDIELLESKIDPGFSVQKAQNTIVLTTHNAKAEGINRNALTALKTDSKFYSAEIVGDFPDRIFPMDPVLELKAGAQVIFTKNDLSFEKRYYNGKTGIIKSLAAHEILVHFPEENITIEVDKYEWQNIKYSVDANSKEITEEILGTFTQYPLKLAWAITVHKSQGLTFDRAAVDLSQVFVSGQLYVALSRLRSLDRLVLLSKIHPDVLMENNEVGAYQQQKRPYEELESHLTSEMQQFLFRNIIKCFDWNPCERQWRDFIYSFREAPPKSKKKEYHPWADKHYRKLLDVLTVCDRFIRQLRIGNQNPEKGFPYIKERFHNAKEYFYPILEQLYEDVLYHSEKIRRQKKAKSFYQELYVLEEQLLLMLLQLKKMQKWLQLLDNHQQIDKKSLNIQEIHSYRMNHLVKITERIRSEQLDVEEEEDLYDLPEKKRKKTKDSTYEITYKLFQEGKKVSQIAEERKLSEGTINTHLARLMMEEKLHISQLLPEEKIQAIAKVFIDLKQPLGEIKELLSDDFSYDDLRFYRNHQLKEKKD